jgi:hypothetical protein
MSIVGTGCRLFHVSSRRISAADPGNEGPVASGAFFRVRRSALRRGGSGTTSPVATALRAGIRGNPSPWRPRAQRSPPKSQTSRMAAPPLYALRYAPHQRLSDPRRDRWPTSTGYFSTPSPTARRSSAATSRPSRRWVALRDDDLS